MEKLNSNGCKHGPWYWVYFRPRWELIAVPADTQADTWGHPQVWRELVVPQLTIHYGLRSSQVAALREVPYSMPRGRVSSINSRPIQWVLWNGNDLPKPIPVTQAYRQLISAFDLKTAVKSGIVQACFDEHEQMLPHDISVLENVLGSIPYLPHKSNGFRMWRP